MQRLLEALASSGAEFVIFDTPPLLGLSDASILASKADGVLVVVDIMRARKDSLRQVKDLVGQAGIQVIGCAVNKQRRSHKDSIYSSYYGYGAKEQNNRRDRRTANSTSLAVLHTTVPSALEEPEAPPQPDTVEKGAGRNHSANNASSSAVDAKTYDAAGPPTVMMSSVNHKGGQAT